MEYWNNEYGNLDDKIEMDIFHLVYPLFHHSNFPAFQRVDL
jgi:hypothetical protein